MKSLQKLIMYLAIKKLHKCTKAQILQVTFSDYCTMKLDIKTKGITQQRKTKGNQNPWIFFKGSSVLTFCVKQKSKLTLQPP